MLGQLAGKLLEECREEGTEKGSQEARIEIARRLLAKGMNNNDVAEITGLSVETVASLRDQ